MALPELHLSSLSYVAEHYLEREGSTDPKFDLEAPYQRGSVWTLDQRRALIKSLLMGLPIGSIILARLPYAEGRASYRVIDGKQRVEAIRAFVAGDFSVPREWFADRALSEPDSDFDAVRWQELSGYGRRRLLNAALPCLEYDSNLRWVHDPTHPKAIARSNEWYPVTRTDDEALAAEAELYGLINGGGTPQTEADMANAATFAEGSVEG